MKADVQVTFRKLQMLLMELVTLSPGEESALFRQRETFILSPSQYGIHYHSSALPYYTVKTYYKVCVQISLCMCMYSVVRAKKYLNTFCFCYLVYFQCIYPPQI